MISRRETIITTERIIADTGKNLVEAEFKVEKLKQEIAKEKVMRKSLHI